MTKAKQKHFFDTFGFFVLKQTFNREEMKEIDGAFEQTMIQGLQEAGRSRHGMDSSFVIDPGFCERNPILRPLMEDVRITKTIDNLFEPGWFYASNDGHLYFGDTAWHADTGWHPKIPLGRSDPNLASELPAHYFPGMKVALYLDPVVKDTGCLRVIPGSHVSPFHESLASLHSDIANTAPELLSDSNFKQFDVTPSEIPCYAIESEPGDVVFFSSMLWHSSFGGRLRRMFSLWYQSRGENDAQRKYAEGMKRRTESIAAKYSSCAGS